MPMQETIRELDAQGVPGREIARRLGVSRNTVAKYAGIEDYSPTPVLTGSHVSKADAFAGVITQWLLEDEGMPRKQRHTARVNEDRCQRRLKSRP
jgi:transcriptional regulator with XRE-family HTH domain